MARPARNDPTLPGLAPPATAVPRRARRGVTAQLTAQRKLGQIEPADAGTIAVARILADAIDDEAADPKGSRYTVGMLATRLHAVLGSLRGERVGGSDGDGLDAELAQLLAALRDAPRPGPPDPR